MAKSTYSRAQRRRGQQELDKMLRRFAKRRALARQFLEKLLSRSGTDDFLAVGPCLDPEQAIWEVTLGVVGKGVLVACPLCGNLYTRATARPALPLSVHIRDAGDLHLLHAVICSRCSRGHREDDVADRLALSLHHAARKVEFLTDARRYHIPTRDEGTGE